MQAASAFMPGDGLPLKCSGPLASVPGHGAKRGALAPKHYTKPRQIIQSPDRLYKAPTDYTEPQNSIQRHEILDKTLNILYKYQKK